MTYENAEFAAKEQREYLERSGAINIKTRILSRSMGTVPKASCTGDDFYVELKYDFPPEYPHGKPFSEMQEPTA